MGSFKLDFEAKMEAKKIVEMEPDTGFHLLWF